MDYDLPDSGNSVRAGDLHAHVGETFYSDWMVIDQARVDAFADITMDHQWIHVDVERAKREGVDNIAHGFLTLSLFSRMVNSVLKVTHFKHALNYGFDKIRFTAAVPVGSRIRMKMIVTAVEPRGADGVQLRRGCAVEIEGNDRPAVVADWLTLFYPE